MLGTQKWATVCQSPEKLQFCTCKKKITTMCKDTTKNLAGQPIFKQIIKMIPKDKFDELVLQQKSDKGYRTFSRGNNS
jgi:hypothetical protein